MKQPGHVLVYRLSALGDVAMTIPAIYSCARTWPDTTFHVVTTVFCAQLFIGAPDNVVMHPVEKPVSTWRLLKQLNGLRIDAVADLHNVLRSWVVDAFFQLKGKKVRMLSKMRSERKGILTHKQQTSRPFTLRYFDVFEALGLPCEPRFSSLFCQLPPLPLDMVKGTERWVGIAPYARYNNKVYPLELMRQAIQDIVSHPDVRVFLFGSRGQEAAEMKTWETLSPVVHSVAGRFTLQEELSLMAHLDTMVSMDSANMHLASLVGTRVVSIWGSTAPACGFLGYGQEEGNALCAHVDCQPCTIGGSRLCRQGSLDCLRSILPESIADRAMNQ